MFTWKYFFSVKESYWEGEIRSLGVLISSAAERHVTWVRIAS